MYLLASVEHVVTYSSSLGGEAGGGRRFAHIHTLMLPSPTNAALHCRLLSNYTGAAVGSVFSSRALQHVVAEEEMNIICVACADQGESTNSSILTCFSFQVFLPVISKPPPVLQYAHTQIISSYSIV